MGKTLDEKRDLALAAIKDIDALIDLYLKKIELLREMQVGLRQKHVPGVPK